MTGIKETRRIPWYGGRTASRTRTWRGRARQQHSQEKWVATGKEWTSIVGLQKIQHQDSLPYPFRLFQSLSKMISKCRPKAWADHGPRVSGLRTPERAQQSYHDITLTQQRWPIPGRSMRWTGKCHRELYEAFWSSEPELYHLKKKILHFLADSRRLVLQHSQA